MEGHTNATDREFERARDLDETSTKNFGEKWARDGIWENTGANDTLECRTEPYKLLQVCYYVSSNSKMRQIRTKGEHRQRPSP